MITKEYLQQELAKRIDGYKCGVETTTDNIIAEMKSILVLVDALNDYEKKYKEALVGVKKYYDMGRQPSHSDLEYIFPELRENEDERMINAIIQFTKDSEFGGIVYRGVTIPKDQMIAHLEKLKENTTVEPKQEWSEEDKDNLNNIIWLCENCEKGIENVWIPSQATQIKNLIKSLRPSWKPSEEEMDALKELIDDANRAGWVTPGATELYEQLKKL